MGCHENNLGVASFHLTPLNKVDPDVETYFQNETCPAVKVTTDTLTGQYDVSLPMHYRILLKRTVGTKPNSSSTRADSKTLMSEDGSWRPQPAPRRDTLGLPPSPMR